MATSVKGMFLVPAAVLSLAVVTAGSPSAAGPDGDKRGTGCPDGSLCVWSKPDYKGDKVTIKRRALTNKLYDRMNDDASSLKLRKSGFAQLFADVDGGGDSICVFGPHKNVPDLSDFRGSDFNDTASSSEIPKGEICVH